MPTAEARSIIGLFCTAVLPAYEEMLVIGLPNITLKNASKTPSLQTLNKGVDIDKNAVRITSYYGHGC